MSNVKLQLDNYSDSHNRVVYLASEIAIDNLSLKQNVTRILNESTILIKFFLTF